MMQIGIVAHTSRLSYAKTLSRAVKSDFLSVDDGTLRADDNHEHVQHHLAGLPSTWSVILEDDAEPVDDFRDQLTHALPLSPSPIVSLYLGKKRPPHWQLRIERALKEAKTVDASWIVSTRLLHAVGYAIRTELLPSLLGHVTARPVDEHISDWAMQYGHTVAYTIGSLVDHADIPTIVEHPDGQPRRPGRKAWTVGGRDIWTSISVPMR